MDEMNNSEKKISLAVRLKNKAVKLGRVFREYPLTLGCIVIIAAIGAVIVDCNFDTEWCERSILFLAAFSAQTLFLEEYFKYKRTIRIAGYITAIPIAALLTYLSWFEGEFFLGMDIVKAREVFRDFYISYFACLALASLYHMYRRLKDPFEAYCLKTFFGLLRISVVYGLFAAGLAMIILIFDILIFHTHSFIERVEIFLAGGIYVPAMLLVLSGKKGEVGRFSKACVLYVLEPMLILAMAIIYVYIVKIFVTNDIPSNSVFAIITSLFAAGMVIWTLACGIGEKNVFCKTAAFLPVIFIPCILLGGWSILIRIREYGFTPSRYFGLAVVIFELIYMVLYLLQRMLKKEMIALILWVAAFAVVAMLVLPFSNYASVCVRSQMNRLSGITVNEDLKDSELGSLAGSAYRVLKNECGYRGREIVGTAFNEKEREILDSCYGGSDVGSRTYYLSDRADLADFDISGYQTISFVEGSGYDPEVSEIEFSVKGHEVFKADVSQFVNDIVDFEKKKTAFSKEDSFRLDGCDPIKLNENYDLKVTWFSAEYNSDTNMLEYLSIEGYLLGK